MNRKKDTVTNVSRLNTERNLPVILFFLSITLNIFTTYYVTGNLIDSDASSELVLAKQLAETGKILSRDWFYSTELRVLNTQLVYAPMFLIFNDWHLVRFFSALVLQAIYVLSFGFMLHQGGFKKSDFYFGVSILLLPVSVTYGRIVLYHCYYIPHIALSFFLIGLLLHFADSTNWRSGKTYLFLILLAVFSFIGGLGGIRQLMITHTPMLFLVLLLCVLEDIRNSDSSKAAIFSKNKIILLSVTIFALAASFLGYKINTDILSQYYTFRSYNETTLGIAHFSNMHFLLYGAFHQFGFRQEIPMLSLLGILSLAGILVAGFCLYLSFKNLRSYEAGKDIRKTILSLFFLAFFVVMTSVFLLANATTDSHVLYYLMCLPWAVPLLLSIPAHVCQNTHIFNFKRLFSWVTVLILYANGLSNIGFFYGIEKFDQPYEGLVFQETNNVAQLSGLVDYLVENGYDAGYATFWECNIITELSDGKLPMSSLSDEKNKDGSIHLSYSDWLTSLWQREAPKQKPFLVLHANNQESFEKSNYYPYCTRIYSDDFHCAYRIDNLDEFTNTLHYK